MKKLVALMLSLIMCFAFAGCGSLIGEDYSSYEGKTFEGESPWGGQISVLVDKISDDKMEYEFEEVNLEWGYNIEMTSELKDGKGQFEIEADDGSSNQAEYTGTIELKDDTVILTFEDGQKSTIDESGDLGGEGYEMVGALEDDQKTVTLTEAK